MKKNVSFENQDDPWTWMPFFKPDCDLPKHKPMTLRSFSSRGTCDNAPDKLHVYGDCCIFKINEAASFHSSWDPLPGPRRPDHGFECHM